MKCFVPEISWHNRDPVYSVDFQPKRGKNDNFYRLASGGADCHVVIWHVSLAPTNDNSFATFECAADLQRHQKCVNVVRFSPSGEFLASGDDDGYIIVWKMRDDVDPPELPGDESEKDKECWVSWKVLRGHLQDVYDLAWSPDSTLLASGSIDNTALIWDVDKRKKLGFLGDHKGFVQGVAWDPKGKYIATLSSDRNLRVFESTKRKQIARCFKGKLPTSILKDKEGDKDKLTKLFHNETLKTFFRRLDFTPLGDLLITPCGLMEDEEKNHDVSYVFTRNSFSKPALHLPSPGLYTVAARSCPILFKLRGTKPSLFDLPYRAVYTIATRNALVLYDTEQAVPFGYVGNIHYTGITDITWSPDGRLLIASSSEGYCSVITFDEGEIGEEYVTDEKLAENNVDEKSICLDKLEKMDTEPDNKIEEINNEINKVSKLTDSEEKMDDVPEKIMEKKTPEKKIVDAVFKTPTKVIKNCEGNTPERLLRSTKSCMNSPSDHNLSQSSVLSELSICVVGDEEDLISKEEQARRLMSPYAGSPRAVFTSPSRQTPKMSPHNSPMTPKSGRRVNLITISSPKSKRQL